MYSQDLVSYLLWMSLSVSYTYSKSFSLFFSVCSHMHRRVSYTRRRHLCFLPLYLSLYSIKYYTATRILCSPRATTVAQWSNILYIGTTATIRTPPPHRKRYNIQYIGTSVLMILLALYYYYNYFLLLLLLTYIGSGDGGVKNNGTVKRKYIQV